VNSISCGSRSREDARLNGEELRDLAVGIGMIIGEKNRFWEDQIQCKTCKQYDIFLLCPQFCRFF
jgi:hypothetical protein